MLLTNTMKIAVKSLIYVIKILTLAFTVSGLISHAEESMTDSEGWSVRKMGEDSIYLSVPGQIIHGDKFFFHIPKGHCEFASANSFLYTMQRAENIEKILEGKYLDATFMGDKVKLKVGSVFPAMLGHIAVIDMGTVKLDDIKDMLLSKDEISITYDAIDGLDIDEYFDVRQNSWGTKNLTQAFDDAKIMCGNLQH